MIIGLALLEGDTIDHSSSELHSRLNCLRMNWETLWLLWFGLKYTGIDRRASVSGFV